MPFYDYKCEHCGSVQEEYHNIAKYPKIICKECGKEMKRVISGGGMIEFWGDGKCRIIVPGEGGRDEKTRH